MDHLAKKKKKVVECIQIVPKCDYYFSTEDGQMSGAAVLFLCLLTCFHAILACFRSSFR